MQERIRKKFFVFGFYFKLVSFEKKSSKSLYVVDFLYSQIFIFLIVRKVRKSERKREKKLFQTFLHQKLYQ